MVLGSQLFLAGFLGELISRNNPTDRVYQIKERVGAFNTDRKEDQ
jgi:hypothetical protein